MKNPLRLALLSALLTSSLAQAAELIPIDVHRDANCGCCKKWISHLQSNGFKVNDHVEADMSAVKQRLGVAPRVLDNWLWNRGQASDFKSRPRHRCRCVFY